MLSTYFQKVEKKAVKKEEKSKFELTANQKYCLQEILDFITNPKRKQEKFYLLTGSPGTGKTFLISFIYSILKENYNILFSASTNKAVNVLQATYEKQHALNDTKNETVPKKKGHVLFQTIHRFMNSRRAIDKNGDVYFQFSQNRKDMKPDVIFIDEVSMIPELLATQINEMKTYKKIILIGDKNQLPPVNELESSVFSWKIPNGHLSQVVRYQNNIVLLADQLKDLIQNGTKIKLKSCEGNGIYLYKDQKEWLNTYYQDTKNSVVSAYTNDSVRNYNDIIRKHLLKKKVLKTFEKGEKIMFNSFYVANADLEGIDDSSGSSSNTEKKTKKDDTTFKFFTSYQINIESCEEADYEIHKDEIVTKMRNDLLFREKNTLILDEFVKKIPSMIPIYYLKTERDETTGFSYVVYKPMDYNDFMKKVEELKEEFIKIKIMFSEEIVRDFWDFYYETFMDTFADITYGYSLTIHKQQGSTYQKCFIDMKDIIHRNPKEREAFQCLYTAITRASHEVHIYY